MSVKRKSPNGQLLYCQKCGLYHLEFGNLNFEFTEELLKQFSEYVNAIDGEYYMNLNQHTFNRRKILFPTNLKGFRFCFKLEELNELKNLLDLKNKNENHHLPVNFQHDISLN